MDDGERSGKTSSMSSLERGMREMKKEKLKKKGGEKEVKIMVIMSKIKIRRGWEFYRGTKMKFFCRRGSERQKKTQ